jgi:multisubunit Na+/H+ antiporter MnhG subunit
VTMIRALQQAAMATTLAIMSLGIFVLYDAFTRAQAPRSKSLFEGVLLCTFALALLYSLGTRDER